MIGSSVVPPVAGRLRFFVAVRGTHVGSGGAPSACLGFDSKQQSTEEEVLAWAKSVRPFCFPLGEGVTGNSKPEPFHFMPNDENGAHGFCRKIPVGTGDQEFVACLLAPWPWFQVFHHATDILAFLLPATLHACNPAPPPSILPPCQAYTFLSSLQTAISGRPSPGAILQIPLPARDDYPFRALEPITIAPSASASAPAPRPLRIGSNFTEAQVPPQQVTLAGSDPGRIVAPLAALVALLPAAVLATVVAALLTERSCVFVAASPARASTAAAAAASLTAPLRWCAALLPLVPAGRTMLLQEARPVLAGVPAALRAADSAAIGPPGALEVDLDSGAVLPALGSDGCCSRQLPGWQRLCSAFETLKVTVTSERDYSANAAITAAMHGFLAATVGTYHDFIKPPPQAEVASKSSSISQGILRALSAPIRFASDMSGRLRSSRGGGGGPRSSAGVDTAPVAMFMPEDNIVYGDGGWRFHHDQFAAALPTAEERTFADALIATKMWPAFMRERLNIMRLPARTGRSDAFELRVLAHLSTVRGRRVRPAGTTDKRSLRPRFGVGASFPSYGGGGDFDPYDPFAVEEDDDEDDGVDEAAPAATAHLQARRAATTSLLGGGTARLTGPTQKLSGGSADAPDGIAMRKLGDIALENACTATLHRPQLYAGMQSAPPRPPAPQAPPPHPAAIAVGAVTGTSGLPKSCSVGSMHHAITAGSPMIPDC